MKKIYLLLATLLVSISLQAQAPGNRSSQTVVADVLAMMPAGTQAAYDKLIGELSTSGEAGVLGLIRMIQPPGQISNAEVDYALSGLSHYVMATGEENARLVVSNAYCKALGQVSEPETKAFIIRQLQVVGKDEAVETLSSYLTQDNLGGPAARALATIGTPKAIQPLTGAVSGNKVSGKLLPDIILAIGESGLIKDAGLEKSLQVLLASPDENTRRMAYYTLSKSGTTASVKKLAEGADKAGYQVENTGANEAYINLLKNLAEQGYTKEAEKAANDLLKKATKAGQTHTRIAALGIIMSVQKEAGLKQILTALKDENKEYRNAALNFESCYANEGAYIELIKVMEKASRNIKVEVMNTTLVNIMASNDVKVDILNWLGREATCPEKNAMIRNLTIRSGLPAVQVIAEEANNNSLAVKEAAIWAMVRIGDKSFIPVLTRLLTSDNKEVITLAQNGLMSFSGDISPAVAEVIPSATAAGKIAGIELLASRKASTYLDNVMKQTESGSPEVKAAAYAALKDVVTPESLNMLCVMLESADAAVIAPLQEAIISIISNLPAKEQLSTVNKRMSQAGDSNKHLYYMVLAATGEQEALNTIVNGFTNGSGAARDAAFDALLTWKGAEAIDELYAIASNPSASAHFDRALTAYIRLVSNPNLISTGENRLIFLRKAMEIAKTDTQKNTILNQIRRTNTFLGMIFAGKFLDDKNLQQAASQAVMNIALGHPEYTGKEVSMLLKKVIHVLDNPDADYQRQAIRKHLSEMPQEDGFVSIFNNRDLTGWKGLVENPIARKKMSAARLAQAQKKADEQMRADWKVENGLLVFDGAGYDNICTVKEFGDIEMYIDWKLDPDGPEPDAGIYLRGTPQVQIWDISRVNVGAQVGSGGLYNNKVHESKPLKVADNKLGEWNSMYIKMVGDRVTVKLNGELVTDDVILENFWDRSQPIPAIEQLELQAHGSKVYYRDIYVKELPRPEPFTLSEEEKKEGYQILFDGTNMHEWVGNTVDYTLEDGTISMIPSRSFGGNLYTKKEYGNFIFRFEFQLTPAANNGLGIRTPMEGDAAYVGMELQILDSEHPVYKDLKEYQYHGSVYGIIPAKRGYLKPVGEWNYQEVIADGDNIKITLNGEVILDGNIRDAVKNGTPDGKEHPGLFNEKGHIGFLGHGSPVKFKNIRIKELK